MFEQQEDKSTGYLTYLNKMTKTIQIDDPNLIESLQKIRNEFGNIKYSTYRGAAKLCALKKDLFTQNIPYQSVSQILEQHRLNQTDSTPDVVKPAQLTALIHDIFYAANLKGWIESNNFHVEKATGMLACLLWNIFDSNRSTPISILELKETLLILCNTGSFDQTIFEHFFLASDHNRCVTRYRFELMVKVLSKLFNYLDDGPQYSEHIVGNIVSQCFEQCPGMVGLNEFQFNELWHNDTLNFACYSNVLASAQRMKDSQNTFHNVECVACLQNPIQGLRFKCQHCRNFSLCLPCFSLGFSNKRHDTTSHRMYEISTNETNNPNKFKSFLLKLCNIFNFCEQTESMVNLTMETNLVEVMDSPQPHLPADEQSAAGLDTKFNTISGSFMNKQLVFCSPGHATAQSENLIKIIDNLSNETDKLTKYLDSNEKTEFLENHKLVLNDLLTQLRGVSMKPSILPHSSTPYNQRQKLNIPKRNYANFGAAETNRKLEDIYQNEHPRRNSLQLERSLKGADINRTYLDENKSLSISDISTWFHKKRLSGIGVTNGDKCEKLPTVTEKQQIDTEMSNFRELIHLVKEIVDDSYSDNTALSKATYELETVLDNIICEEEQKRFK